MNATKNFFAGFFIALILSCVEVVHAEEIDPYFLWEIKNFEDYAQSNLAVYGMNIDNVYEINLENIKNKLFAYDINIGDIESTRAKLYTMINKGEYSAAATLCKVITVYQKIIFGKDFFDESLTELNAKLYLITGELDAAEWEINLLSDKAQNNLSKIRALNLKSALLNRRGNYSDALTVTVKVAELLQATPNENFNLINQARAA